MKTTFAFFALAPLAFGCVEAPLPMDSLASMESVRLCWRATASINEQVTRDYAIVELVARGWSPEEIQAAAARRVYVGMNREAVFCAWGKPTTIDASTTEADVYREQFAYRGGTQSSYLAIENGFVTSISH